MRDKVHRGSIRQRQAVPGRRVLGVALALLMLLASLAELFQPVGDLLKALWQPGKDQQAAKSDAASWKLSKMAIRPLSEFDHFRMSRWRNRFKSATLKEVAAD